MIRRPIEPLKMLFVVQGSYFKRLIVPQVLLFIFSFLIYFYQTHIATEPVPLNPSVFAILGISLAIFHGFCNNAGLAKSQHRPPSADTAQCQYGGKTSLYPSSNRFCP